MPRQLSILLPTLAFLILCPRPAEACNDAQQERLIPLGSKGRSVLAFRVQLFRGGKMETEWTAKSSLVSLTADGKEDTHMDFPELEGARAAKIQRGLLDHLEKALEEAKRSSDFRPFRSTGGHACSHRTRCGGMKLRGGPRTLSVLSNRKYRSTATKLSGSNDHGDAYRIAQSQHFENEDMKIAVVDVRTGNPQCSSYVDKSEARRCARPRHRATKGSAPAFAWRPILHHGEELSILLWPSS